MAMNALYSEAPWRPPRPEALEIPGPAGPLEAIVEDPGGEPPALAVVNPEAGNIGGGGFLVLRMANGETAALDFREEAPAAATRDMFLDAAGEADSAMSLYRGADAGVPGTGAGMKLALA